MPRSIYSLILLYHENTRIERLRPEERPFVAVHKSHASGSYHNGSRSACPRTPSLSGERDRRGEGSQRALLVLLSRPRRKKTLAPPTPLTPSGSEEGRLGEGSSLRRNWTERGRGIGVGRRVLAPLSLTGGHKGGARLLQYRSSGADRRRSSSRLQARRVMGHSPLRRVINRRADEGRSPPFLQLHRLRQDSSCLKTWHSGHFFADSEYRIRR